MIKNGNNNNRNEIFLVLFYINNLKKVFVKHRNLNKSIFVTETSSQ